MFLPHVLFFWYGRIIWISIPCGGQMNIFCHVGSRNPRSINYRGPHSNHHQWPQPEARLQPVIEHSPIWFHTLVSHVNIHEINMGLHLACPGHPWRWYIDIMFTDICKPTFEFKLIRFERTHLLNSWIKQAVGIMAVIKTVAWRQH